MNQTPNKINDRSPLSEQSVAGAAGYLFAGTALSKMLGFARDMLTASLFGVSAGMDSFIVAQSVSSILGNASGSGIATAFLPAYARKRDEAGAVPSRRLMRATMVVSIVFSLILVLIVAVGARPLISLFAPDLDPEVFESTVQLTRVLSVLVTGYLLYYLIVGMYHAMHHFVTPSFSQIAENIIVMAILLIAGKTLGINALVLATILGIYGLVTVLIIPMMRSGEFAERGPIAFTDAITILKSAAPLMIIYLSYQGYFIVERYFASGLSEGSISSLAYAKRIIDLPNVFFVTTMVAAIFPRMSSLLAQGKMEEIHDLFTSAAIKLIYALAPTTVVILCWRKEIVSLVFQRGEFGFDATQMTSTALFYYGLGLLPTAGVALTGKLLYAANRTRIPLVISLIGIGVSILSNWILVMKYEADIAGIAFSTTIMMLTICIMQYYYLHHINIAIDVKRIMRVVVPAVLCAFIALPLVLLIEMVFMRNVIVSVLMYFLLFYLLSLYFLEEQVYEIHALVKRRFHK